MSHASDFEEFWSHYPRRVGKLAAQRAYQKARRQASADAIIAGVMAYVRTMPQELRFVPYPATWLNAGRWMDDMPVSRSAQPREDWWEECKRLHGGTCMGHHRHHTQMILEAGRKERESV